MSKKDKESDEVIKMTLVRKKAIKKTKNSVTIRVQSKCFSKAGNSWRNVQIEQLWDEGRDLIGISNMTSLDDNKNPVTMVFNLDDIPSLIATLQAVSLEAKIDEFESEIREQTSALKERSR
jgi:hypothetical protein